MTITRNTWLTVNGIDLATHAWLITDLSGLLEDGRVRGGDKLMPGARGVRPFRRRRTVRVVTLPMDIFGDVDEDGEPTDDPLQGGIDHLEYLAANLGIGEDSPNANGTVEALWTRPDGSVLAADVHVLGLIGITDLGDGMFRTTLDLSIPAGRFQLAASS